MARDTEQEYNDETNDNHLRHLYREYPEHRRGIDERIANRKIRDQRIRNMPPPPKPGLFDGLLLMIPDWALPSRDSWYGRMYG